MHPKDFRVYVALIQVLLHCKSILSYIRLKLGLDEVSRIDAPSNASPFKTCMTRLKSCH